MPANPRREARRKAGFRTQAEFAEWLGWHPSSVGNVECGQRKPPPWYDKVIDVLIRERELKAAAKRLHDAAIATVVEVRERWQDG